MGELSGGLDFRHPNSLAGDATRYFDLLPRELARFFLTDLVQAIDDLVVSIRKDEFAPAFDTHQGAGLLVAHPLHVMEAATAVADVADNLYLFGCTGGRLRAVVVTFVRRCREDDSGREQNCCEQKRKSFHLFLRVSISVDSYRRAVGAVVRVLPDRRRPSALAAGLAACCCCRRASRPCSCPSCPVGCGRRVSKRRGAGLRADRGSPAWNRKSGRSPRPTRPCSCPRCRALLRRCKRRCGMKGGRL